MQEALFDNRVAFSWPDNGVPACPKTSRNSKNRSPTSPTPTPSTSPDASAPTSECSPPAECSTGDSSRSFGIWSTQRSAISRELGPVRPETRKSETTFRHSGWQPLRQRVRAALVDLGTSSGVLERFDNCGSNAWILRTALPPFRYKISADYCKNRWCVPCQTARAALIAHNLHHRIHHRRCKLITLTIRHSSRTLPEQIDHLYKSFSALRRRKIWQDAVSGGAAVLELHHTGKANGWHPHLHIVAEAGFIPQKELAADWHAITRDSFVVDVRAITRTVSAARYVTKYLSKPLAKGIHERHGFLVEAVEALHGRKQVLTFGTWREFSLTETPDDDTEWVMVGELYALIDAGARGDDSARAILRAVKASVDPGSARPPPGPVDPRNVPADMLVNVYA